jgi:hypothetical protein
METSLSNQQEPSYKNAMPRALYSCGSKSIDYDDMDLPRTPLLVQKEVHTPVKKGMSKARKTHILNTMRLSLPGIVRKRRDEIDKCGKYGALCVLDAFQGRLSNGLANNSKKDYMTFLMFSIQTSDWFLNLVVMTSIVHTVMIFFEPVGAECSPYSGWLTLVHWLVFVIQLVDVLMKMHYEGISEYLGHDWQQLYATTVLLHFLDLLWYGKTNFTNPLRPIVGLLRARSVRRFFTVVKSMIPSLTQTLAPLVAFLMIITVFCNLMFADTVSDNSLDSLSYNWLWLVLTNDTFSRLFPANVESHALYAVFFFATLYVGQRFILSVVLGHTFETFTAFTSKQVKKEKQKEMQGLVKAFTALDMDNTGYISEQVWVALMRNLSPGTQKEEIALYYELISAGNREGIFIFQFLSLADVLSFKFERVGGVSISESKRRLYGYIEHYADIKVVNVPDDKVNTAGSILTWVNTKRILRFLNWIDIVLLNLSMYDTPLLYVPLLSGFSLTPCHVMSALLCAEFALKCMQNEGRAVKLGLAASSNIYTLIFVIGTTGLVAIHSSDLLGSMVFSWWHALMLSHRQVYVMKVSFRCLRCCRMFYINDDLRAFISAVIGVGPIFFQNMLFAVIVAYIFAMVGNILFGAFCEAWSTPLRAMVTVEKLFLPFDLLDIMEDVTENVHPAAIIYFLVYFLMSLIICNLSLSIVIELYSDILKLKGYDPKQDIERYEALYKSIVERAMTRKVLAGIKCDFHSLRMVKSNDQKDDHRIKFVDGELGINMKDLKACQKYAKLNLVKLFENHNRKLKDVTWEADFVRDLKELGMGKVVQFNEGDKLITSGQDATKGFLLIGGTVRIIEADGSNVTIGPTHILGNSFLCPNMKYTRTCIANKDSVECIVIQQSELEEQQDHAVIGQLLRMCFKSEEDYQRLLSERSRRWLPRKTNSFNEQMFTRGSEEMPVNLLPKVPPKLPPTVIE